MAARTDIEAIKRRFGIIGTHPTLNRAIEVAHQVAPTDLSVLITGESGVGKEFFPQIVHQYSRRKHGQYIAVNCGAIPEGTIDSELFGHVKGSFTGALDNREGYFEVANGGTIFLDEVAELPLPTQARLLRVLESGEFIRVGSSTVQKTDIRVIAATNVKLEEAIREGRFREDLFYRLSSIPIFVPPLRARGNDVVLLFMRFAIDFGEKYNMPPMRLGPGAEVALTEYSWPGNVRQLKNVTEQISIIEPEREATADTIRKYLPHTEGTALPTLYQEPKAMYKSERELLYDVLYDMRRDMNDLKRLVLDLMRNGQIPASKQFEIEHSNTIHDLVQNLERHANTPEVPTTLPAPIEPETVPHIVESEEIYEVPLTLANLEEETIRRVLEKHRGHRRQAAEELGISERTLYRKIKEYDIEL